MRKFVDEVIIHITSGDGGSGSVHFHSEKFIEFGGPDGGDGGKGGDVYFKANPSMQTLDRYISNQKFNANNGEAGAGRKQTGRNGEDLVLYVPIGTQITDVDTDELVFDFKDSKDQFKIATGGRGGKGNTFFKSSTNQAPKFAQPGEKGTSRSLRLTLKLLADVGLIGLPNSGKSTLLSKLTNATPKIADYQFTTLIPNIGVIDFEEVYKSVTIADIPGIIEGANKGVGLGLSFLKHIERVKIIVYLLDASSLHPEEDLKMLQFELAEYNASLLEKPFFLVFNKIDVWDDPSFTKDLLEKFKNLGEIIPISALKNIGLDLLKEKIQEFSS